MTRTACALAGSLVLSLARGGYGAEAAEAMLAYPLEQLVPRTQWWLDAWGDRGASAWDGATLKLDYTRGASAVLLRFADRALAGAVRKMKITVEGSAPGHPVSLHLRTHFMTFSKTLGEFGGTGRQVLETDGPPGPGWTWSDGENDGKIHGPIRLAELRVAASDRKDTTELRIVSVEIVGVSPIDRLVYLTARCDESSLPARFTAELRVCDDKPMRGTLVWKIRRWDGDVLTEGRRALEIPAGLAPCRESIDAPALPDDCRFAEAEFRLEADGQAVPSAQAYWLGRLEPNTDFTLEPDSPLGMGVYLNRFDLQTMQTVAKMAGEAGVKWTREDFGWGGIERAPGQYQWDYHDKLIETAHRYGISVYAIVAYWPGWSKAYTPEGIRQYADFMRVLVRRYRDRIHAWEIWNEPNIFFWQGPREMYADLLIAAYKAVKEEDPKAQVLGLSTAGIDFGFIELMLAKGTPFDVLTIHPYRKVLKDAEFIADLAKSSDAVRLPDGTRRPVWITEMGWATHVPHPVLRQDFEANSRRAQASYLARSYLCTIASGVKPRTFWYNFRNDGDDPFYFEHNMGIVELDGRPKPAYVAFATMSRVLRRQRFAGRRDDLGEVFAAGFESAEGSPRRVLALWSAEKDAVVKIPSEAAAGTVVNTMGETRAVARQEGRFELQLKAGAPVYFVTE